MIIVNKLFVFASGLVIVMYTWDPVFKGTDFTSRDIGIIIIQFLSVIVNAFVVLLEKKEN